jgi:hypothetical protein
MSASGNSPSTHASPRRPRIGTNLRVSDADRAAVADRLAKHYADGRLDQAEFTERVDLAMSAKIQSDFTGLFADLPDTDRPEEPTRRRHRYRIIVFLILAILVAAAIGQALVRSYVPWLAVGLFAFLWLRYYDRRHRRL